MANEKPSPTRDEKLFDNKTESEQLAPYKEEKQKNADVAREKAERAAKKPRAE